MNNLIANKFTIKKVASLFFALVLCLTLTCGCSATQANSDNNGSQKPAVEQQQKQEPTSIILVRHGQTDYNVAQRLQGQIDVPLNDNGINQANLLADYLKDTKIDVAIASPLSRALVTGQTVAKYHNLDVITDPRLMEWNFGDWSDQLKADLAEAYPNDWECWLKTPWKLELKNGEKLADVGERGKEALTDIAQKYPGKNVLVAAHSLFNQASLCSILDLGYEHYNQLAQDNTSITVLKYDNGEWKLMTWNETPHLGKISSDISVSSK